MKLPENEARYLMEVTRHSISDERFERLVLERIVSAVSPRDRLYEVSKDLPRSVFGRAASAKTMAQAVRQRLVERDIIQIVDNGDPSKRAVIRLIRPLETLDLSKCATSGLERLKRGPGRPRGQRSLELVDHKEADAASKLAYQDTTRRAPVAELKELEAFVEALRVVKRYPELMAQFGIVIPS